MYATRNDNKNFDMCLNPITIPNKNFQNTRGSPDEARYYKHNLISKMEVSCGWCKECITAKQMAYIQRIMEESTKNEFYMITLTYKEDMIPKYKIGKFTFRYADTTDFTKMCKRMDTWRERKDTKHKYVPYPFRYFAVTELGGKKHRPHVHAIIAISKEYLPDKASCLNIEKTIYWAFRENWQRNTGGNKRKANYKPLFEYHETFRNGKWERNYDCHYVDKELTANGIEDCAWYVMKYMLKDCDTERRRQQALKLNLKHYEYEKVWDLIRTRRFYSTGWGLNPKIINPFGDIEYDADIVQDIRQSIEKSKGKYPYPCWINKWNGKYFPLCKYYKDKFLTLEDLKYFWDEEYELKREIPDINLSRDKTQRFEDIKRKHMQSALNNF